MDAKIGLYAIIEIQHLQYLKLRANFTKQKTTIMRRMEMNKKIKENYKTNSRSQRKYGIQ